MPKRPERKLLALLLAGVAGIVVAIVTLNWTAIETRYRLWRLDGAETYEEAGPWLDAIVASAEDEEAARMVIGAIAPDRPRLSFWLFHRVASVLRRELVMVNYRYATADALASALSKSAPHLPLIRELESRLPRDEARLELLARYVRWCGPDLWTHLEYAAQPLAGMSPVERMVAVFLEPVFTSLLGGIDTNDDMVGAIAAEPRGAEAALRLVRLLHLAEAWLLGMDTIHELPPLEFPASGEPEAIRRFVKRGELGKATIDLRLQRWLGVNREFMRFDESAGRFVIERGPNGAPIRTSPPQRKMTLPETPFPGWTGPLPPRDFAD